MCAIFGDCRLRGVGMVRGVSLPSPIDLTRRPCNVTLPCDRVIHRSPQLERLTAMGLSIRVYIVCLFVR